MCVTAGKYAAVRYHFVKEDAVKEILFVKDRLWTGWVGTSGCGER